MLSEVLVQGILKVMERLCKKHGYIGAKEKKWRQERLLYLCKKDKVKTKEKKRWCHITKSGGIS
jgi:hypothetical protein